LFFVQLRIAIKYNSCWAEWILLVISVVHLIVLGLLWSVAIAIVCSLPKVGKVTPISE
jgi:hypothetical protein